MVGVTTMICWSGWAAGRSRARSVAAAVRSVSAATRLAACVIPLFADHAGVRAGSASATASSARLSAARSSWSFRSVPVSIRRATASSSAVCGSGSEQITVFFTRRLSTTPRPAQHRHLLGRCDSFIPVPVASWPMMPSPSAKSIQDAHPHGVAQGLEQVRLCLRDGATRGELQRAT